MQSAPELVPRECEPTRTAVQVDCYWLPVPEDRNQPDGRKLRLAVAVLNSIAPEPAADPVVFLQGGPAHRSVENLTTFEGAIFLQTRDLVVFDQRGIGLSEPALECPEVEEAVVREAGSAQAFAAKVRDRRSAYRECRNRLERNDVDLDQFNTENSAADVADLRVALGVDAWNLWAVSYGTRLALATMRSHPEGVRSVILDSVYPTTVGHLATTQAGVDDALTSMSMACEADTECAAVTPDLERAMRSVVRQFDETPFEGTVDVGAPFDTVPLVVNGSDVYLDLLTALSDTSAIPRIPSIVRDLAEGQTAILPEIAQQAIPFGNEIAEGAFLSIECADSAQRLLDRDAERLLASPGPLAGLVLTYAEPYCDAWGVEPVPPAFNEPVRSDIPTLVLAGTYDPLTPVRSSRAVTSSLENATYVEFDGFGHAVSFDDLCVATIGAVFVADPDAPLDVSCAERLGPVFVE